MSAVSISSANVRFPKPQDLEAGKEAIRDGKISPELARACGWTDGEVKILLARRESRFAADHDLRVRAPELRQRAAELNQRAPAAVDPEDRPLSSIATIRELRQALAAHPVAVPAELFEARVAATDAAGVEQRAERVLRETCDPALVEEGAGLAHTAGVIRGNIDNRAKKIASLSPAAIETYRKFVDELAEGKHLPQTVPPTDPGTRYQEAREKLATMQAEAATVPRLQEEQARDQAALAEIGRKAAELEKRKLDPRSMDFTIRRFVRRGGLDPEGSLAIDGLEG